MLSQGFGNGSAGNVSHLGEVMQPVRTGIDIVVLKLIGGWVPGGRPPAWAAGEAIPWPSPGQKAAETLESEEQAEDPPELENPEEAAEEEQSR